VDAQPPLDARPGPDQPPDTSALPGVWQLLLRDRPRTDAACADRDQAARLLPAFLGVSAAGIGAFAVCQGLLMAASGPEAWMAGGASAAWLIFSIFVAFEAGLMGAQVASLPSWYFYALLTGIRTHGWRLTVEALRARATASVVLVGLLPVYLSAALGLVLLFPEGTSFEDGHRVLITLGFGLPFLAGLVAPASLLRVLHRLARDSEGARPVASRRRPMPWLMALAWTVLFASMAPLGVFRALVALLGV